MAKLVLKCDYSDYSYSYPKYGCGFEEPLNNTNEVPANVPYICPKCGRPMNLKVQERLLDLKKFFEDETL